MITRKELENIGWTKNIDVKRRDKNKHYYDQWEYEFRLDTQELYYLNDGMCEELITKVYDIDELVEIYWALEGKLMKK